MEFTGCRMAADDFDNVVRINNLGPEYEPELPAPGKTAREAPVGKIAVYREYFFGGNFRLPTTRFLLEALDVIGLHLSQIHPLGMARLRHFEYTFHCLGITPTANRLATFYRWHFTQGWYTLFTHPGSKAIALDAPQILHEWKSVFFYVSARVVPYSMHFTDVKELAEPKVTPYTGSDWFTTLQASLSPLRHYQELALFLLGMSRIWEYAAMVLVIHNGEQGVDDPMLLLQNAPEGAKLLRRMELGPREEPILTRTAQNFVFPLPMGQSFAL